MKPETNICQHSFIGNIFAMIPKTKPSSYLYTAFWEPRIILQTLSNWYRQNIRCTIFYSTVMAELSGEFSKSAFSIWENEVSEKIKRLSAHYDNIVIVAHSLGTLLAINAAIHFPEKIKQLFLIAVPLKITVKPSAVWTSLKVAFGWVKPGNVIAMAAKTAYSIEPTKKLYEYLGWAPRFYELLRKQRAQSIVVHWPFPQLCSIAKMSLYR